MYRILGIYITVLTLFLASCRGGDSSSPLGIDGLPLSFAEQVYVDSSYAPPGSGFGMLKVDYSIAYVQEEGETAGVAKMINSEIISYEFGDEYRSLSLPDAISKSVSEDKDLYLSLWIDSTMCLLPDSDSHTINYEYEKRSEFVKGKGGVLCYESHDYIYTAGAHGVYGSWVLNFDYTTGRLLTYSDVFEPAKDAHVRQLIQQCLIADLREKGEGDVESVQDLKEYGYMFEENLLPSTSVFRLGEDGVTFIYGIYSIAPYAMGETKVTVPYDMIEYCIKEDVKDILSD